MWNGFWKLTVMVGVIGVGLYAVYCAQQGMHLPLAFVTGGTDSGTLAPPPDDAQPQSDPLAHSKLDDMAPLEDTFRAQDEPRKPRPVQGNGWSDSTADQGTESSGRTSQGKISLIPNRSDVRTRTVSRSLDDFDTNDKPAATAKSDDDFANSQPSSSGGLQNEPAESTSGRQPFRQTSSVDNDEPEIKVAPKEDPFGTDAPTETDAVDKQKPLPTTARISTGKVVKVFAKEPQQQQQQQNVSDFDSEPPPIQSNRAKRNSAARAQTTPAADLDSPAAEEEQPKANSRQSKPAAENLNDDFRSLEVPAKKEEAAEVEQFPAQSSRSKSEPELQAVSNETTTSFDDDLKTNRPVTVRARQETPIQLPSDTSAEPLSDRSPRKSPPPARRNDSQRVVTVADQDMIGDGVAGDPSLRGVQQPRLTIEKVAAQQAVIEQPLVYTIIVKNTGNVDAHNVVIEDRIPKGTELLGTSPQAELSGKRLTWNHVMLRPNEEKKISVKVLPKQEGPIGSVARVYFATEVTAEIVVAAPQLEFTVKVPTEVRLDQRFELVFNLKNVGKVDASNIIVRDLVPAELKNDSGNDIECPVGKLAPGEVREIVLPVSAITTGSARNRAILTADSGVKKTLDSSIDIVGEILVLTRTGQNRLYVERPVVFTNSIRNEGNQQAEAVNISEVVPAGMQFDSASHGGRFDPNLRAVVWALGPLPPGGDKQVTVKYVPRETGVHSAKITATGSAGSTAAVNAAVEVVGKPELQMETLTATGAVTVGDRITSRFQLNNTGTAPATGVQLRVKLPNELKLISVNKTAKYQQRDGDIIFDTISELAPGSKASFEMVLEPVDEADAQIVLEIAADHLLKPGRRIETIQIARDGLN